MIWNFDDLSRKDRERLFDRYRIALDADIPFPEKVRYIEVASGMDKGVPHLGESAARRFVEWATQGL